MSVHFFALSRGTKDKPDCIKTFHTFESQIVVFGNIFAIKITFILNHLYCSKRGYLCSDCACARSKRPFEMK